MNHYEIMYIIPLKMGDESNTTQEKVHAMLQAEGAKITLEENMGKRKLAYPIDHIRHGSYVLVECDLESNKIPKVSEWLRLSGEILRAQVINKKIKSPEQMAREKALQEKLAKQQARAEAEAKIEPKAEVKETGSTPSAPKPVEPKLELDELDKKLEQILENEIVK